MAPVPLSVRIRNKAKDVRHNLFVRLLGTRYNEEDWASRQGTNSYMTTLDQPHRDLLIKIIEKHQPTSALEVGSNSGPNLVRLAQSNPDGRFVGIDVSSSAIDAGKKNLRDKNLKNIELMLGKADDLSDYPDGSFDVVFTDAVLIYIGKDKIDKVRNEMLRVAKKAIVLVEWHDPNANPKGTFIYKRGYWKRNYVSLFDGQEGVARIDLTKITRDQWDDDCWSSLGYVIEVSKETRQ